MHKPSNPQTTSAHIEEHVDGAPSATWTPFDAWLDEHPGEQLPIDPLERRWEQPVLFLASDQ